MGLKLEWIGIYNFTLTNVCFKPTGSVHKLESSLKYSLGSQLVHNQEQNKKNKKNTNTIVHEPLTRSWGS